MWKDATGNVVPIIGWKTDAQMLFMDSNGWLWSYDLFNADLVSTAFGGSLVSAATQQIVPLYYTTTNCTGTAYVANNVPTRYTFQTTSAVGSWQVRSDNILSTVIEYQSLSVAGECRTSSTTPLIAVPQSSLTSISVAPVPQWVLPLHAEFTP